jgi:hypothetical protein
MQMAECGNRKSGVRRLESGIEMQRSDQGREQGETARADGGSSRKKRLFIFDERSRYVIENKGSAKRTKPNEADFRSMKIRASSPALGGQMAG